MLGLGSRLQAWRMSNGCSRSDLSQRTGGYVRPGAIEAWEQGRRKSITVGELLALALATGIPPIRMLVDFDHIEDPCDYPHFRGGATNYGVSVDLLQRIPARTGRGPDGNGREPDLSSFGGRLAATRKRLSKTVQRVCDDAGRMVEKSAIESWESGRRTRISVEDLLALSYVFAEPPVCLLFDVYSPDEPCDYPPLQSLTNREAARLYLSGRYRRTKRQMEDARRYAAERHLTPGTPMWEAIQHPKLMHDPADNRDTMPRRPKRDIPPGCLSVEQVAERLCWQATSRNIGLVMALIRRGYLPKPTDGAIPLQALLKCEERHPWLRALCTPMSCPELDGIGLPVCRIPLSITMMPGHAMATPRNVLLCAWGL